MAIKKVFSTIDLVRVYHQIPVNPAFVPKPAVALFGLFVFLKMPFELRNAAQTFQWFIDNIVKDLDFVYVYIDNVLVASETRAQHIRHLRSLFERLHRYGIVINSNKCTLCSRGTIHRS